MDLHCSYQHRPIREAGDGLIGDLCAEESRGERARPPSSGHSVKEGRLSDIGEVFEDWNPQLLEEGRCDSVWRRSLPSAQSCQRDADVDAVCVKGL